MLTECKANYKHVIWDWNGTLLDDINVVIDAMNCLLKRRSLPILDMEKYKDIFVFPVKDYYAQLGFDFDLEPFEILAAEFIAEFNSEKYEFKLHNGVEEVLNSINSMGISQSILSATQETELNILVRSLNIHEYFLRIAGLSDHYAISKVERGIYHLTDLGFESQEVLLIGDTVHDYEVSKEIGCDCLLICNGHQSFQRISNCHTHIINSISEVVDFIKRDTYNID